MASQKKLKEKQMAPIDGKTIEIPTGETIETLTRIRIEIRTIKSQRSAKTTEILIRKRMTGTIVGVETLASEEIAETSVPIEIAIVIETEIAMTVIDVMIETAIVNVVMIETEIVIVAMIEIGVTDLGAVMTDETLVVETIEVAKVEEMMIEGETMTESAAVDRDREETAEAEKRVDAEVERNPDLEIEVLVECGLQVTNESRIRNTRSLKPSPQRQQKASCHLPQRGHQRTMKERESCDGSRSGMKLLRHPQ